MIRPLILLALLAVAPLVGCKSAYYSTMEKFGVHKRDILVDRVEEGREEQQEAKEQIQTTFEVFKELASFEGGDLEENYSRLKKNYERSSDRAEEVRDRIESIQTVSEDLFSEWEDELETITSQDLRHKSEDMLLDTRRRCETLVAKMRRAEQKMTPVLQTFSDHVVFLKHSLNAQAVASLRDVALEIETDVDALIAEMQASIEEADSFIAAMEG